MARCQPGTQLDFVAILNDPAVVGHPEWKRYQALVHLAAERRWPGYHHAGFPGELLARSSSVMAMTGSQPTGRRQLDAKLEPDGYNVGFNAGEAAGQTVDHMHIHVIPRYHGDMSDPRGGVRHVIPSKGNYLRPATEPYALLDGPDRLLRDDLLSCLRNPRLNRVDLLVSFVMKSALEQLHGGLVDALDRGARIRVLTTDYLTVTDADAWPGCST